MSGGSPGGHGPASAPPGLPGAGPDYAGQEVDFVVVGAGGAGGIVAYELARAGLRVALLEQGPWLTERDFAHDEVRVMREAHLTNDWARQPNTFRRTPDEVAKKQPALIYGRAVGGGTLHFTGNYWRFHPVDFAERSRIGPIAGTGLEDWPLTYDELEPYYTRAEAVLGVSGRAGASPFDPPRSKPYPLPPLPVKSSGVIFERAARKLGWHPFPAPMAIPSRPHRGRPACQHCGFCMGFGCEYGAKSSTMVTVVRDAIATGRCELRPNCYVSRIETDERGRATGVLYFDREGKERRQRARAVVVCANGAETPRLLLMSESSRFPDGLANGSGLVGRYLMFNGFASAMGAFEHPLNEFKSVQVTRIAHDWYFTDPARGFYGGGGLDARFGHTPIGFALGGLPPDAPKWGAEYKKLLRRYFVRSMEVAAHSTSLPLETNSVSLDPEVRDAWGLPAMRITYRDHPDDVKMMQYLLDRALELLDAAGAERKWVLYPAQEQSFGFHLLGTCRMGDDPATSVVDRDHRAHDVRNLFLCDGSSLVTGGRGQPTATIQALAFRAGERIARAARRAEI